MISVKEITTISKGLHYHVLYFTDKELNYSRIHKKMPPYADINIQFVKKTAQDIQNVLRYMNKTKNSHKQKSTNMQKRLSIFDFKIESKAVIKSKPVSNKNKVISRLTLFDIPEPVK